MHICRCTYPQVFFRVQITFHMRVSFNRSDPSYRQCVAYVDALIKI